MSLLEPFTIVLVLVEERTNVLLLGFTPAALEVLGRIYEVSNRSVCVRGLVRSVYLYFFPLSSTCLSL